MDLNFVQNASRELVSKLRLPTNPIGIKYIRSADEIPDTALQPTTMAQKWSFCQAFTYARRWDWHVAMTVDDNLCVPGSCLHHWPDLTGEQFVESQVRQGWHKDRRAEYERLDRRLEEFTGPDGESLVKKAKTYCGFTCFPLTDPHDVPDSILIFGDGTHITHLIWSLSYETGTPINSSFDGFGETCYKGAFLPFMTGKPQLVLPGMGDRGLAAVQDNELAVGFPADLLEQVAENLFKTGGETRNPGLPMKSIMATNLDESITPGFQYLREELDKHT